MAWVEVDVDLDDFSTAELIRELEYRGVDYGDNSESELQQLLSDIYQKRRTNQNYQNELDKLIYDFLGKM